MRLLFIILFLFSSQAFAGLRQLGVKNLSLDYTSPSGTGTVEKLEIGLSKTFNHPLEVTRLEDTFLVKTPMLDFHWLAPWKFLFEAQKLTLSQANISAGKGKHDFSVANAKLTMNGEFTLRNGVAHCEGSSEQSDLENQLLEDCRANMTAEADRLDVPLDSILVDVLARLPMPEEEEPLKNLTFRMQNGNFYMYFYPGNLFKAGLRTWGAVHYENELKTMVVRVDLIKFGILPVTAIVLRELRQRVNDPRIELKPPFIRIRIKE